MNISFSLTTEQVRFGFQTGVIQKDVTRRLGWLNLRKGQILQACRKCMGLKKGEKPEVLGLIEVVDVRREPLRRLLDEHAYGIAECKREGFGEHPKLKFASQFVEFFCATHKGCTQDTEITRILFRYL